MVFGVKTPPLKRLRVTHVTGGTSVKDSAFVSPIVFNDVGATFHVKNLKGQRHAVLLKDGIIERYHVIDGFATSLPLFFLPLCFDCR